MQGDIHIDGKSLRQWKRKPLARTLGILFQDSVDTFPTTVMEIAMTGRYPYLPFLSLEGKEDIELVSQALREVALDNMAERQIDTLSGGERRRLALATLLVQDPVLGGNGIGREVINVTIFPRLDNPALMQNNHLTVQNHRFGRIGRGVNHQPVAAGGLRHRRSDRQRVHALDAGDLLYTDYPFVGRLMGEPGRADEIADRIEALNAVTVKPSS